MPKVSIILPTYKRADSIKPSIDCILSQTYTDFELIIVDDCSGDNTEDVVLSYEDSRIRFLSNPVNMGAGGARNTGIAASTGEYIAFQDSDTIWDNQKLEKQVLLLDSSGLDVGMVYTKFTQYSVSAAKTWIYPGDDIPMECKSGSIFSYLLQNPLVGTPTMLIRKTVLEDVGVFAPGLRALEDYELSMRIAERYQVLFLDEPLLTAYMGADSISLNIKEDLRVRFYILDEYRDYYNKLGVLKQQLDRIGQRAISHNALHVYADFLMEFMKDTGGG